MQTTFWFSKTRFCAVLRLQTLMDNILNYELNPEEDFYTILGCDECSGVSVPECQPSINADHSLALYRGWVIG